MGDLSSTSGRVPWPGWRRSSTRLREEGDWRRSSQASAGWAGPEVGSSLKHAVPPSMPALWCAGGSIHVAISMPASFAPPHIRGYECSCRTYGNSGGAAVAFSVRLL